MGRCPYELLGADGRGGVATGAGTKLGANIGPETLGRYKNGVATGGEVVVTMGALTGGEVLPGAGDANQDFICLWDE